MYLKISNKGNIVPEAFSLVGASTKRDDNDKIGMFGSGNKYALAYFFRNNYEFTVITGDGEIEFSTVNKKIRDDSFDVICINGDETSITTEMGHHWSLWQALREIYSNAMDESLVDFSVQPNIWEPTENQTDIYIEMKPELRDIYENINDYFAIDKEVVFENEFGKIYKKSSPNTCIYRKGIRCYETDMKSLFDYDFNDIKINETRVVRYSWQLPEYIWRLLYSCDNEYVVRTILNKINAEDHIEKNIDDSFVSTYSSDMNDSWKKCVEQNKIAPKSMGGYVDKEDVAKTFLLPTKLYHDMVSTFGDEMKPKSFLETSKGVKYKRTGLTELMIQIIKEVQQFFDKCGFEIPYEIDVVDFINKDIHGGINENTILISKNAFDRGKTWIANIMIEEYIHIKYDAPDESRKFQDEIIHEFLTYMKTVNSFNL